MRYVAGLLYGLAAAHGADILLDGVGTFVCVAAGTVAALFAVQAIVRQELGR